MLKQIIIVLLALFFSAHTFSQTQGNKPGYSKEWNQIDSFINAGFPKSAQSAIEVIYTNAQYQHDTATKIKAQIYLLQVKYSQEENSTVLQIKDMEVLIENTSGVEKAIWQSLTAEQYFTYYQNNRYQLYNRTKVAGTVSDDINTWDVATVLEHSASLYEASLEQTELLQHTTVAQYEPLMFPGLNTKGLRPTLYDLLAFKAIGFFENGETGVTRTAGDFQMDGSLWFETAERFSSVRVKLKDASSYKFRALRIYQNVLAFHLHDSQPDALIDADISRLQFIHSNSVYPKKDSLYLNALQDIVNHHPQNAAVAQAAYLIINDQINRTGRDDHYEAANAKKNNRNLPLRTKELKDLIAKFPKSEGAVNAQNLLNQISAVELSLQTEEVNIPDENIKSLITYRNLPVVFLALYKLPFNINGDMPLQRDSLLFRLRKSKPVRSWQQRLPGFDDMEAHKTEIKIDALPVGNYIIIGGSESTTVSDSQMVVAATFQVSNISLVMQEKEQKGYLLHRKTGYPLAQVKTFFYGRNYKKAGTKEIYEGLGNSLSNADGMVSFPTLKNDDRHTIQRMLFVNGDDSLCLNVYWYKTSYYKEQQHADTSTFFFTDRAIYRPGQTVFFKGIMVESNDGHRKNEVIANYNTSVTLYDVNNQKVASLHLKTNEFGSFTGSFQLPEGLLNGNMRISNEKGSQYFSLEEYKRPKFYIDFDTLKGNYVLNENVTVKGFAKAYAGNNIDGAQVKYNVVRKTIFPYYWCYYLGGMPYASDMEIAHGTSVTDTDGSFRISFESLADQSIDAKTMPVFHYFVTADITDMNGETHSGDIQVNSGYTNLQIDAAIPEESGPKELQQLNISTQNLNGVFEPATISISIARLKSPGFLRKRLWNAPDQFVMTEGEYQQAFPGDEYKEEGSHLNWQIEKTMFEKTVTTTADGLVAVPIATWYQNGWYVIEIKTRDAKGNEITEKKYTHVWVPGKKEQTQEAIVAYTEKDSYEPGEKIALWLGTAVDHPYLLHASSIANNNRNPIEINVQEKDRGGILFSWLYISNNRVYTLDKRIDIPWSNKELQLEWATHRDKLMPGAKDSWTITIKGNKKENVAAELLTGMYDASLDAFKTHSWNWKKLFPVVYNDNNTWNHNRGFGIMESEQLMSLNRGNEFLYFEKIYNDILFNQRRALDHYGVTPVRMSPLGNDVIPLSGREDVEKVLLEVSNLGSTGNDKTNNEVRMKHKDASATQSDNNPIDNIQIRKNLQETAFFFPQLKTDTAGNVSFSFEMPEALTEWKWMAFGHTKDWRTGYLGGKVKTQKDLMVVPNLPRFFRQNDNIEISTKIVNLSETSLKGSATIALLDAQTLQPIPLAQFQQNGSTGNAGSSKLFEVAQKQSTTITWNLHIPESRYTPVIVRIVAKSGVFSDGEENTLPVLTNRMLVTETMPVTIRGNTSKNFTLDKLLNNNSNTLTNHSLTVEFTGNPAWYAIQALPYLMEYPYECAEQTFNRFYANALAQNLVAQSPKVHQVFNQWLEQDSAALVSGLQKNETLKTALLEETPWVMDAKDETEQKHRMALLFQTDKMAKELDRNLDKLGQMQLPDGSFPWFKGMYGNRFITQYILTGMGRLQNLNTKGPSNKAAQQMYSRALYYVDAQVQLEYNALLKSKADMQLQHIYNDQVQYLYMRSFYSESSLDAEGKKILSYYKSQAVKYWSQFNSCMKGQIALALNRMGDAKTALRIVASLKETAIHNEEQGMYWKDISGGYNWFDAPIESQSVLIEAFSEVAKDTDAVEAMKLWLLKQKQTQNWKTTKATADACYALLLTGNNWLTNTPDVKIQLGNETIASSKVNTEAGSGYFQKNIAGKNVTKEMANIQVIVSNTSNENNNKQTSWGAVYWQYFEEMDKITETHAPISLSQELLKEQHTNKGPELIVIKGGNILKPGDKVKIRIVVKVDRDMEYVQLKDMRAACFEPVDVLSGYHYQNGISYYQSTKDMATNFFFDHLPKGTYVFEYPVWVNERGNFSNGITTIQCMYAPQFSSHTKGIRVEVQ